MFLMRNPVSSTFFCCKYILYLNYGCLVVRSHMGSYSFLVTPSAVGLTLLLISWGLVCFQRMDYDRVVMLTVLWLLELTHKYQLLLSLRAFERRL